ncbi:Holliday junction branch migration DNA helicase RuvB [Caldilinea sp.]|jgi:Holliday junction DNA helicase RuvB|uniref:Holliday junction branch migration DNA helicase RuvB n=1 Tax=Caldilinea sp. TaxID=2293560 RepID=UPI0026144239|nr:Holliday junction branch migration DNA helicase RuvB [uncultured Caldilinea sp.]
MADERSATGRALSSQTEVARRALSGAAQPGDQQIDHALRPRSLREMIGQERLRDKMQILVEAARRRGDALDHVLLYGPPGLGKTTLSHILAYEMGANLKVTAGPAIEKAGDLAAILTNLRKGDILFIDEIHRLGRAVEEILYPAMEDFSLNIVVGSGPGARNIQITLPKFTVVGATTRLALMTSPLRARFGVVERFDFYEPEALQEIVVRAARLLETPIEPEGSWAIARRARGTPRVALRLLRRLRDYAQVRAQGVITAAVAEEALSLLEIDELGLDDLDRRVLQAIIVKFGGGPVGLDTLAASISEEPDTIMDVVEPYLLQLGFLDRTPRGRVATRAAYAHLNIDYPERPEQAGLFG